MDESIAEKIYKTSRSLYYYKWLLNLGLISEAEYWEYIAWLEEKLKTAVTKEQRK